MPPTSSPSSPARRSGSRCRRAGSSSSRCATSRKGDAEAALARGQVLKQVARCRLGKDGAVRAEIRIEALPASHPLAAARDEENSFLVTDRDGVPHTVHGKGAGRWPSAAAVFADVMDLQRALASAGAAAAPERLRA